MLGSQVEGVWKWGEQVLPIVSKYACLGVDFVSNGAWDEHMKRNLDDGRNKVNKLRNVLSNREINAPARRLLLLSVVRDMGMKCGKVTRLRQLRWSLCHLVGLSVFLAVLHGLVMRPLEEVCG